MYAALECLEHSDAGFCFRFGNATGSDPVFRQPHFLNLLGMLACRANPIDDGPFFVPFSTRQAADTTILRDQGQGVNDLIFGCAAAIEG
jgi:hypothetical protein